MNNACQDGGGQLTLSARDMELLETLVRRVRVFTVHQVARTWWKSARAPYAAALRRLTRLEGSGLLVSFTAVAHPELPLTDPVIKWAPGAPPADFGAASYRLKTRWSLDPVQTRCIIASRWTTRRLGGFGGRRPRESEETHDIHFARVYLLYRERHPRAAANWITEDAIRVGRGKVHEKLPDALIQTAGRQRVVEFGGAYSKNKLEAFHHYCSETLRLPYEVW